MCQVSFKRLQYTPKIFEKRMYNPRNVTYKSTTHVYFLTKTSGRITRNWRAKKPQPAGGLKINAKMKVTLLFILSVRRADEPGNVICPDLTAGS